TLPNGATEPLTLGDVQGVPGDVFGVAVGAALPLGRGDVASDFLDRRLPPLHGGVPPGEGPFVPVIVFLVVEVVAFPARASLASPAGDGLVLFAVPVLILTVVGVADGRREAVLDVLVVAVPYLVPVVVGGLVVPAVGLPVNGPAWEVAVLVGDAGQRVAVAPLEQQALLRPQRLDPTRGLRQVDPVGEVVVGDAAELGLRGGVAGNAFQHRPEPGLGTLPVIGLTTRHLSGDHLGQQRRIKSDVGSDPGHVCLRPLI